MEADLRSQIQALKSQLMIEENGMALKNKSRETLEERNTHLEAMIASSKEQVEYLKGISHDLNKSYLMQAILHKLLSKCEPDEGQQQAQYSRIKEEYENLMKQYEQCPDYRKILEAEADERKLTEKVLELRNELMKLEVQAVQISADAEK